MVWFFCIKQKTLLVCSKYLEQWSKQTFVADTKITES